MVRTILSSASFHCYNTTTDKIFIIDVVEVMNDAGKLLYYSVEWLWGVRGKTLRASPSQKFGRNRIEAQQAYRAKLREITALGYEQKLMDRQGRVYHLTPMIQPYITSAPAPAPAPQLPPVGPDLGEVRNITIGDL